MDTQQHIVKSFDQEIVDLNARISEMGNTCRDQLEKAIHSLNTSDFDLARSVIRGDADLNLLYAGLEDAAVRLLARRQPVAVDLRYLLSALRVGAELERIGDYAASIAKRVMELTGSSQEEAIDLISQIALICREMLIDSVESFVKIDVKRGMAVWHRDNDVDRKFARMMTLLRQKMQENTEEIEDCTQLIFMGRCLERIGDHITNIAEDIFYIETGENYITTVDRQ
ncbi:phosphate signaling complex protein PhoU [Desulfospira joergensenii]|uniref:phosphate signaling complex protein PhoU n=1 Tax=Desulfospira joergensenii TaxID=53329 RepID=UPI0003B79708|nr:phosphate signaling complex protein PhoU [Desulfospira joergensenii]